MPRNEAEFEVARASLLLAQVIRRNLSRQDTRLKSRKFGCSYSPGYPNRASISVRSGGRDVRTSRRTFRSRQTGPAETQLIDRACRYSRFVSTPKLHETIVVGKVWGVKGLGRNRAGRPDLTEFANLKVELSCLQQAFMFAKKSAINQALTDFPHFIHQT